ncbi:MAG: HNH endonuclease [Bacteroidetes bacterium]|nr:HNH endonuclease [Bacteroidota bacterium]
MLIAKNNLGLFKFIADSLSNTYTDKKGYKRFKDSNKPVHRSEAEKKLGRKLKPKEVVHHKDRDKTNNSFRNLHVFPDQKTHDKVHKYDASRFGNNASYKGYKKKKKGFWDF